MMIISVDLNVSRRSLLQRDAAPVYIICCKLGVQCTLCIRFLCFTSLLTKVTDLQRAAGMCTDCTFQATVEKGRPNSMHAWHERYIERYTVM